MKTTFGIWHQASIVTGAAIPRNTGRALSAVGVLLVRAGESMNVCGEDLIASAAVTTEKATLRLAELRKRQTMSPLELEAAEIADLELQVCLHQDAIIDADAGPKGASLRSIGRLTVLRQELSERQTRLLMFEKEHEKALAKDRAVSAAQSVVFVHPESERYDDTATDPLAVMAQGIGETRASEQAKHCAASAAQPQAA